MSESRVVEEAGESRPGVDDEVLLGAAAEADDVGKSGKRSTLLQMESKLFSVNGIEEAEGDEPAVDDEEEAEDDDAPLNVDA